MFATVMCLVLSMCILISCSCVCVDGLGYVCESYVVLVMSPPPCLCSLSVRMVV